MTARDRRVRKTRLALRDSMTGSGKLGEITQADTIEWVDLLSAEGGRVKTREHKGRSYTITPAHPVADEFPWMSEDELQELADDIKTNGQRQPIVKLRDGRIVDGRNRELACLVAGAIPWYCTL